MTDELKVKIEAFKQEYDSIPNIQTEINAVPAGNGIRYIITVKIDNLTSATKISEGMNLTNITIDELIIEAFERLLI